MPPIPDTSVTEKLNTTESRRDFLGKFASGVFAGLVAPAVLGEVTHAQAAPPAQAPPSRRCPTCRPLWPAFPLYQSSHHLGGPAPPTLIVTECSFHLDSLAATFLNALAAAVAFGQVELDPPAEWLSLILDVGDRAGGASWNGFAHLWLHGAAPLIQNGFHR